MCVSCTLQGYFYLIREKYTLQNDILEERVGFGNKIVVLHSLKMLDSINDFNDLFLFLL